MANNKERRAVATAAATLWVQLGQCLADISPSTAGLSVLDRFFKVSSLRWGQGAWMVYSELTGLRTAAKVMGFYLDPEDLQRLAEKPTAPLRMIPDWAK